MLSQLRLSGRVLVRVDSVTSECYVAFAHAPMLRVHVAGPSALLTSAIGDAVEEYVRATCVRPNWWPLPPLFAYVTPRQAMLEWYTSRAAGSPAAALALQAALAALSAPPPAEAATKTAELDQDDGSDAESGFVLVADEGIPAAAAAPPPAALTLEEERATPVGVCSASAAMICVVDQRGHVHVVREGGAPLCLTRLLSCPLAVGTPPSVVHACDEHGRGVAWLGPEQRVILAFLPKGSLHWWWKQVPHEHDERVAAVAALVASAEAWHCAVVTSGGTVLVHSNAVWDARSTKWSTTKLLLTARCTQALPLPRQAAVVCATERSAHVFRLDGHGAWELHESYALPGRAAVCAWQTRAAAPLLVAVTRQGELLVGGASVATDVVGCPAVAGLRGDVWVAYRDIMGHINVLYGTAPEAGTTPRLQCVDVTALHRLDTIAVWDPALVLLPSGLGAMQLLWIASDGCVHSVEGSGHPRSCKHAVVQVLAAADGIAAL